MKTKVIKQEVSINATPVMVYEIFMSAKHHAAFTGFPAKISKKTGGYFNTCGNRNWGYNLYLEEGKRIIQAWRQKGFPNQRYSVIDITLEKFGKTQCRLTFYQFGAPDNCIDWLKSGWKTTYWNPLKKYLAEGKPQ